MNGSFSDIFKGKSVLVTGHTGFKGSWLSIWLTELGAKVTGYSLAPYTKQDNFVISRVETRINDITGDIQDFKNLKKVFQKYQPEFVFHLAAQSLVRQSYQEPKLTYDTNIGGTVNVLECCRLTDSVRVIINVTSDKCYEDRNPAGGYKESDPLGGYDPYSSSKGCSEIITSAYRNSFFNASEFDKHHKVLSSVRAGNVIGGGDWREDRLIPDSIRALKKNEPIGIRSPHAVRPWQYVLEPLNGYLLLASKMYQYGMAYAGAWNFGPEIASCIAVEEIVKRAIALWGSGRYKNLSGETVSEPHESTTLKLDISKAKSSLGWKPALSIDEVMEYTIAWYKETKAGYNFCAKQIQDYVNKTREM